MTTLRWGIIGCGKISNDFVTALRSAARPHKIVALGASSVERATEFRTATGLDSSVQTFGSYDEVLAQPDVDIVYIGVVTRLHENIVLKALEAGKKILSEKPLGINSRQVNKMIAKAQEKKIFLMEALWSRFFPAYTRIREEIKKGELGTPKSVLANFTLTGLPESIWKDLGTSSLYELGIYLVQLATWVFPEKPSKITADCELSAPNTEDWATISLQFGGKGRANLFCSPNDIAQSRAVITFTNGYIELPGFFWCPTRLIIHRGPVTLTSQSQVIDFPLNQTADEKYVYNNSRGLNFEADHVYDRIAGEHTESDVHPLQATRILAETLEDIRHHLGIVYDGDADD